MIFLVPMFFSRIGVVDFDLSLSDRAAQPNVTLALSAKFSAIVLCRSSSFSRSPAFRRFL